MRKMLIGMAAGAAMALAGCGGDAEPKADAATSDQRALQERVDQLEAEASERKAARARERRREERRARERRARERREREREQQAATAPDAGVDQTSGEGGGIVVPNVVGLDHQAAQDALQGEGLWILDEQDCTGQDRLLLFDRNWEVVSTDPPAGTAVSEDATITLCSKKQGE
jgi:outer membrane murein-binding lipoprotein Lpp